jgi:hypothetical protein
MHIQPITPTGTTLYTPYIYPNAPQMQLVFRTRNYNGDNFAILLSTMSTLTEFFFSKVSLQPFLPLSGKSDLYATTETHISRAIQYVNTGELSTLHNSLGPTFDTAHQQPPTFSKISIAIVTPPFRLWYDILFSSLFFFSRHLIKPLSTLERLCLVGLRAIDDGSRLEIMNVITLFLYSKCRAFDSGRESWWRSALRHSFVIIM